MMDFLMMLKSPVVEMSFHTKMIKTKIKISKD